MITSDDSLYTSDVGSSNACLFTHRRTKSVHRTTNILLDGRRCLFDTVLVGTSVNVDEMLASKLEYLNGNSTLLRPVETTVPAQGVLEMGGIMVKENGMLYVHCACSSCACAE